VSNLAYRDTPILSTLLREFPKVSPLVTQTQLPDKKLLQAKLHEFYLANVGEGDAE
jgi:hypothetical protein